MIDPSIYSAVATAYSEAIEHGETMLLELTNMGTAFQTLPADSNVIVGTIILSTNTLRQRNGTSTPMITAVRKLQQYITANAGSVDAYLSGNSITVTQTFADISEDAGYPIDAGNIDG